MGIQIADKTPASMSQSRVSESPAVVIIGCCNLATALKDTR